MEIRKKNEGGVSVVSVVGKLDAISSQEFEKEMAGVIAGGEGRLVLDFSALDYISSAGLRAILTSAKKVKARNGTLRLASLKSMVKEVFDVSGFSSIVPIYESVDLAVEQIG
jgi:anti-anti-sigma factor